MSMSALEEGDFVPYSAAREVGRGRALVLAPHPDDEVLGCAGAILRHRSAGDPVSVVVVTDGGHADDVDRSEYVRTRRLESERAAKLLGCDRPTFWDLPDRSLEYGEELIDRISAAIERTGAEMVYAPSPEEWHRDHNALGLCALEAARRSPREIRIALYEVSSPLRANLLLDITDLEDRKREAIACFVSQLARSALDEKIGGLNRYRTYTLPADVRAAEAYRVLSRSELREDPLRAFTQPASELESRVLRGALAVPLISVIVRTTGRETLGEALGSIAAQTYPHLEVVLVDAKGGLGLGRSFLSRCGRFPIRVAGGEHGLGRGAAANAGLDAARGAFAAFLDDDDWLYPDHFARLHDTLRVHRYARAAYAGVDMVEMQVSGGRRRVSVYNDDWDPARLLCVCYIPIHAVLFQRSLVTEHGCRFDEALPIGEDWDFWIQLSRHTPFVHVPEVGGAYRLPGGSALYDRSRNAGPCAAEAIFAKWSKAWTEQELESLWNAARNELSPDLRRQREAELSHARAEAEQARGTLATRECELRVALDRADACERRAGQAEEEVARVRAALAEMSSSSAVRAARFLRSLSPPLHRAVGRLGRNVLSMVERPGIDAATSQAAPVTPAPPTAPAVASRAGAFQSCPDTCGQRGLPGVGIDRPELVDYSQRETTPDQSEIEEALDQTPLQGKRILHVGIGNSGLARRFAPRALAIEGLTVSAPEHAHACALGIPNYSTHLLSKYDPRLCAVSAEPFDIIIDNNLAGFACCKHHFYSMFEGYAALLRPGGELFTHKLGMEWVAEDPRWRLTDEDLEEVGSRFGFILRPGEGGVRVLVANDRSYLDFGSQTPSSRASSAL